MGYGQSWSGTGPLVATSLIVKGIPGSTGDVEITSFGTFGVAIRFWNVLHTRYSSVFSTDPDPVGGSVLPTIELDASTVALNSLKPDRTVNSGLTIQAGTQPFIFIDDNTGDGLVFDTSKGPFGTLSNFGLWQRFTVNGGYQNGWSDLGGNNSNGAYRIMLDGNVQLKGTIIGGTKTDATVIYTMPVGYRPPKDIVLGPALISGGSTNPNPQIRIASATGNMTCFGISTTTTGNLSLEGLQYSLFDDGN